MTAKKSAKAGRAIVRPIPGQSVGFKITYRTEADLRASLAELASLYGWDVEEEVVVPGWGRIDLVLRAGDDLPPYLVELKLALTKPSEVRRAFQQTDGYGRWWAKERNEANVPLLVAKAPDMSIVTPVADAYPGVPFRTINDFIYGMHAWHGARERFRIASLNVDLLREQLEEYERGRTHLGLTARRADEASAHADHEKWIADGELSLLPVVDF